MMKKSVPFVAIAVAAALLMCFGCEVGGEYPEPIEGDESIGNEAADASARFSTANNLSSSLLKQIHLAASLQNSNSIQYPFCIYTINVSQNAQTESKVQSWATTAMNTWIAPLVGQDGWKVTQAQAYRVQRSGGRCPTEHNGLRVYSIEISNMKGANNSFPGFMMRMGDWGINKLVVLHEMGHAIGLGDGYSYADGSHTPIGQPTSTMKDQWNLNGVLQQDDIDGVRFLWARIRGVSEPCPAGYKTGGCNGSRCSGAVYCVPTSTPTCVDNHSSCASWAASGECQKNPGYMLVNCKKSCNQCSTTTDQCPTDPNKTQPGQCGCGTPDTDSDNDGTANCMDSCPSDPKKTSPGQCGCGVAEGTCGTVTCVDNHSSCASWAANGECQKNPGYMLVNCKKSCKQCSTTTDQCPSDPNKTQPGQCGCGTPDTDSDNDGTANCKDSCPSDPKKTSPGQCGCGKAEGTCGVTCADNTSFVDAQGYRCSGWVGYNCTRATEDYGYTASQEATILANCKKTCKQC